MDILGNLKSLAEKTTAQKEYPLHPSSHSKLVAGVRFELTTFEL